MGFAQLLGRKLTWDSELWDGIFDGLGKCTKTIKEWRSVISFLENNAAYLQNVAPGLRVLNDAIGNTELPLSLQRAEKVFALLWKRASDIAPSRSTETGGWFFTIKDHVGGIAVQFWVSALWRYLKRHNINKGIPRRYKRVFEGMLSGNSPSADFGCAMLAYYIEFFYSLDDAWTRDNILPLLNWSIDEDRAERGWQCYLNNSRLDLSAFEASMDYDKQTFSRILTKLGIFRESFIGHVALFAAESFADPLANNWLADFLSAIEASDREQWAGSVGDHLESLNADAVTDVWNRWLDRYWAQRISRSPLPLEQGELDGMLLWLPRLRPVFPAAVRRACSGPSPGGESYLYDLLGELDWLADYPEPLADLLCFLLGHATRPFYACEDAVKLVKLVSDGGGPKRKLEQLCNRLCELGCRSADDLQVFLR